jgi:hypothetical protein
MLSNARHMRGGETELMKGGGTTLEVKAPQMVRDHPDQTTQIVLTDKLGLRSSAPGGDISHTLPPRSPICLSVSPLSPLSDQKNPLLVDDTTNQNVRKKSHLTGLYYQWTTYRLDVIP